MPGRIRPGRFSTRSLSQQPKWMSVHPPKLRYAKNTTLSNNPFKELAETDVYNLRYVKLNEFNTVFTASKNAIEFNSSTTHAKSNDTRTSSYSTEIQPIFAPPIVHHNKFSEDSSTDKNFNDACTSNHSNKKVTLAPPIFPLKKLTPHSKLITLCNKFQRKCTPMLSNTHGKGNDNDSRKCASLDSRKQMSDPGINMNDTNKKDAQIFTKFSNVQTRYFGQNSSLLLEARKLSTTNQTMGRPSSKTSKSALVTIKPDTAAVVIRAYSREKLIATILEWFKNNPHPDNPKTTSTRKLLKKDLVNEVFKIQDLMRVETVLDDTATLEVPPETSATITQSQTSLEVEDVQRLIGEKYFEQNGKRMILAHLHGKPKQELLLILNTMEPECDDIESDDEDSTHYEEDDEVYDENEDDDDNDEKPDTDDELSIGDFSLSDSVKQSLQLDELDDDDGTPADDEDSATETDPDEEDIDDDDMEVNNDEEKNSDQSDQEMEWEESYDEDDDYDNNTNEEKTGPKADEEKEQAFEQALTVHDFYSNSNSTSAGAESALTTSKSRKTKSPTKPTNFTNPRLPKGSNKKKFTGLGYGAERLNGCDISALVPPQVSESYNNRMDATANIRKVDRLTFYIRPRLHVHDNRHAPTLIKAFIRVLRQIDPTLILLPLDESDNSLNHIINNETNIPDDETSMAIWIAKIRYNIHQKLCFSARISITMPIKDFKSHAFPWCKEHKHWITFDEIIAEETFTPGWICGLHHKNVNIDHLKEWLCSQEGGDEFTNLIKIYPRKIWQNVPNTTEKRMTDVLAIDGSAERSDAILKFLFSVSWKGIYDTVTFIPLKINEVFTVADMIQAIDNQNIHRNNEFCKSIVIPNNDRVQTMQNGNNMSFLEWALMCRVRGVQVFRNVFANDENYVKFVYAKESHKEVRAILSNLYETVEKKFSESVAKDLFTSKAAFKASLNIKEAELEYMQATAAAMRSNPQGSDHDASYKPKGVRATLSFGPPKVLGNISYSQAAKPNEVVSSQHDQRIKELEEKINVLNHSSTAISLNQPIKEQASSLLQGELQGVFDLIEKNKQAAEKKIKSVVQQVKRSEVRNKKRIKKSHSTLTQLMLALHNKTLKELKPPSPAKNRRLGGGQ